MYQTIHGFIVRDQLTDRDVVLGREDWRLDCYGPSLQEEVDMQAWTAERMLSIPSGEVRDASPATCERANGFAASSWSASDYEEMEVMVAPEPVWGGWPLSEDEARDRLHEVMQIGSAKVETALRADPWDLRGDRVAVVEEIVVEDTEPVAEEPVEVAVARALMTVPALLAASDIVLAGAKEAMEESDGLLEEMAAMAKSRPSGVTDTELDDEEERPAKPLVYKNPEPLPKFHRDDWGFPISPPPGEPEPEAEGKTVEEEEPEGDSEPVVLEGTMNTRVQLTGYMGGDYIRGEADNFEVDGKSPLEVKAALQVLEDLATERFGAEVRAGRLPAKGGPMVRVQLQPKPTRIVDGRAVKGEPIAKTGFENLGAKGMRVAQVAPLVSHLLGTAFGMAKYDPAECARAWAEFSGQHVDVRAEEPEDVRAEEPELLVDILPDLVGVRYNPKLHKGLCAVVEPSSMVVRGLWETEADALAHADGRRVVDAEGWLVPVEARL